MSNTSVSTSTQAMIPGAEKVQSNSIGSTQQAIAANTQGVALRSVTKKYGSVTAIKNINLEVAAGSYCCLLGPSGCGKTTTLRIIAGHEEASGGDVFIGDQRVNSLPPAKRNTAMVFQNYALFPHKTVWENIEFGLKMRGIAKGDRATRTNEMLNIVGLENFANRKPNMLSGGQQQRVALARALVTRPQVLLLDEPLSALDENLRVRMRIELRKLQRQFGMTFIQVTHVQDEAFSLSDQIVVMDHGLIEQIGTPESIFNAPASRFVARFVGDNNIFVGKVVSVAPATQRHTHDPSSSHLIQLEVDGIGSLFCHGQATEIGTTAACSIRSDRMHLKTFTPEQDSPASNQISARVTVVEFTGYVTRVSLLIETTGQEIIYKIRSHDLVTQPLKEGQLVNLGWTTDDCIFLSH